jgi:dolichol-phosphate mannosyltransferase
MVDFSLVVPTLDEEGNIGPLLDEIARRLRDTDHEVIVVDDRSSDGTVEEVRERAARDPRVRLIARRGARDLAASLKEGFDASSGRVIGSMNADGSHDPADLPRLLQRVAAGAQVCVASRYAPGASVSDWTAGRRLLSRAGCFMARRALALDVSDPLSGYYVLRREVYERAGALREARGFKALMELLVRGRPDAVAEVPIVFRDRRLGRSKMSTTAALAALASLWELRGVRARA